MTATYVLNEARREESRVQNLREVEVTLQTSRESLGCRDHGGFEANTRFLSAGRTRNAPPRPSRQATTHFSSLALLGRFKSSHELLSCGPNGSRTFSRKELKGYLSTDGRTIARQNWRAGSSPEKTRAHKREIGVAPPGRGF